MRGTKHLGTLLLGFLALAGSSCAAPSDLLVLAPGPASIDLRAHGPVAVVLAEPPRGAPRPRPSPGARLFTRDPRDLEDALVAALLASSVPVVERGRYDAVLSELRVNRSDLFDPTVAARLGRHVGAMTIVTARVYEWGYEVSNSRGQQRERLESYTGKLRASVRAIDVGTSAVVAAVSVEDAKDLGTYTAGTGSLDAERKLSDLKAPAIGKIVRDLVPIAAPTYVPLFASSPLLESGNRAATIGSWGDAERLYTQAIEAAPDQRGRDEAMFNVAVAQMFLGKFEDARRLLRDLYIRTERSWVRSMLDECEQRASQTNVLVGNGTAAGS